MPRPDAGGPGGVVTDPQSPPRDTVLVTGAHGAIGCWVVRELVRRGAPVVGLDLGARPVTPFPELAAAPIVSADVRDVAGLSRIVRDHDVGRIVHLAAIVVAERDPTLAIEVNALATGRLLDLAAEVGVRRVVAMSTKGVLGALDARYLHPHYEPVPVDLPPSPRGVYAATKLVVEVAVTVHRARGLDAIAVRLATTWGPGKTGASHGGFSMHSDVVAAAARGDSARLDIHPDQGYDLVYYADVAAGLADLVLAPGTLRSPVYHLGSGRITTVAQFASAVETAFPGVTIETGTAFASGRSCLMDIAAAQADAGYVPAWDVARALADVRSLVADGIAGSAT
jgi:UDP-glucose 4-epimerase